MSKEFIQITQGPAVLADETALQKDEQGFTHPNLHRRVDATTIVPHEVAIREYDLAVRGVSSYRTTTSFTHDEESHTAEAP